MVEIDIPDGMTKEDVERLLKQPQKKTIASTGNDYVEFARLERGRDEIRVYRDVYKSREMLSIRTFYLDPNEERKPGKGLTFDFEHVDDLIEGLQKMKEWLEENPGKET